MVQSKKELIENYANELGYTIAFNDDIERHENTIIIKYSDGTQDHIWVDLKPIVQNDNLIKVNYCLQKTRHNLRV